MTDTLTTAKSLTIQTIGANSNTWGGIENTNLNLIDKALGQTLTKAIVGNTTLNSTEAQNRAYEFTGVLSANATITFPAFQGPLTVRNKTTGGFQLILGMATGTTVTVGASSDAEAFSDGTDFFLPSVPGGTNVNLTNLTLTGNLTGAGLIQSGTGVSTGDTSIELGVLRTGDGNAFVDFHAQSSGDYDFRLLRQAGVNGAAQIVNVGTGSLILGANSATALTIDSGQNVALTHALVIAQGGSGATTAAAAFAAIAVASSSIANPGYIKFQNGLIFQWGTQAFVASTSVAVTFPIAFPTALFAVIATPIMVPGGNQTCGVQGQSTTGFNLNVGFATSNSQFWFAVGN